MSKVISMEEIVEISREQLERGGKVEFTPKGISMLPMLRDNLDSVVLIKPDGPLKKYDVPLYTRKDGSFVLHRVVGFSEDGSYIMCGDNLLRKEYGVTDDDVIAVMTAFTRKGKSRQCTDISYRIYCRLWCFFYPLRAPYQKCRSFLGRVKRKCRAVLSRIRRSGRKHR